MNEDKRTDWLCETAIFEALEVLDMIRILNTHR